MSALEIRKKFAQDALAWMLKAGDAGPMKNALDALDVNRDFREDFIDHVHDQYIAGRTSKEAAAKVRNECTNYAVRAFQHELEQGGVSFLFYDMVGKLEVGIVLVEEEVESMPVPAAFPAEPSQQAR